MKKPVKREATYKELKDRILAKRYIPNSRLPTEPELAALFEITRTTMRLVLARLEKEGLIKRIRSKGTFVCSKPPRPIYHVIGIVGCIVGSQILQNLNYETEKQGYQLICINYPGDIIECHPELLLQFPIDGVIFLGSSSSAVTLEFLRQENFPVIGNVSPEISWMTGVEFDHRNGYGQVLDYLIGQGHRRIAFIEFSRKPEFQFYLNNIEAAFREKLRSDFDPELFMTSEDEIALWHKVGEDYLQVYAEKATQRLMSLNTPPTAIISLHSLARYIPAALRKTGKLVPRDVSLVSVGYPLEYDPQWTTLIARIDKLILLAFTRMLAMLNEKTVKPEKILIPMDLKIGKTTEKMSLSSTH